MSKVRVNPRGSIVSESFAERLRKLRYQKGVPQRVMAEQIGMSAIHYGRYEQGKAMPNSDVLKRLSDALGVSGDYLLGGHTEGKGSLEDRDMLALFEQAQQLADKDKQVVKTLIEAFLIKKKVHTLTAD